MWPFLWTPDHHIRIKTTIILQSGLTANTANYTTRGYYQKKVNMIYIIKDNLFPFYFQQIKKKLYLIAVFYNPQTPL